MAIRVSTDGADAPPLRLPATTMAWLAAIVLAACGGGGASPPPAPPAGDTTAPTVQATSPAAGASAVAATTTISVTFSEPIDPSTLTSASFSVAVAGSAVAGSVAASGPVATFTPAAPLAAGANVTITVSTALKDLAGNPLAAAHNWSFATAAAAARSWSSPVPLELADGSAGQPAIAAAMDAPGGAAAVQATAVWVQHDGVQASIYANRLVNGVWQGASLLENDTVVGGASAGGVSAPRVRMGAFGRAVTTWIRDNGNASYSVWAYAHDQPAVPTSARLIGGGGTASDPQVAFDTDGHAAFTVWTEYDTGRPPPAFRITQQQYLYAACDFVVNCAWDQTLFGWRGATLIETEPEDTIAPQVAGFGQSGAVAVWGKAQGAFGLELWGNTHSRLSGWSSPARISTSANRAEKQVVAAAPDGSATAVWIESIAGRRTVLASRLGSTGWSLPLAIDDATASQADEPQVAVDANGNALIAWVQLATGAWSVRARRCPPGPLSGCAAVVQIAGPAGSAELPRLAGAPSGDAVVVWLQADAAGQRGLYASAYTAAGGWSAGATLVDAGAGLAGAQVAIDKGGIATAVWSKTDAAGKPSIYASRYR